MRLSSFTIAKVEMKENLRSWMVALCKGKRIRKHSKRQKHMRVGKTEVEREKIGTKEKKERRADVNDKRTNEPIQLTEPLDVGR